ncbi:MAG: hypothetical protein HN337_09580 [Deltaproteobacteria bacterium]|jgi:hypothetical protein|nr:hypothetical protein [Deltaproteobacteria bacterium]
MTNLTALLSGNPHVSGFSVATIAGCEVAVAYMPSAQLMRMPFDAFAISSSHQDFHPLSNLPGYKRFDFPQRQSGISELFALKNGAASPALLFVSANPDEATLVNHTQTATISALQVADTHKLSSIAFISPFSIDDDSEMEPAYQMGTMLSGITTALQINTTSPFTQIVIGVESAEDIRVFDDFMARIGSITRKSLLRTHRNRTEGVGNDHYAAYLKRRMSRDTTAPSLIRSYTPFSPEKPLILQPRIADPSMPISLANMQKPSSGYIRLISNRLLDRAMKMVPEFIRTVRSHEYITPYHYSRVALATPIDSNAQTVRTPIRGVTFAAPSSDNSAEFIVGEIALIDLPYEDLDAPYKMGGLISQISMPRVILDILKSEGASLPDDILTRVTDNLDRIRPNILKHEEIENFLIFAVLHECAEILWASLPDTLRNEWKRIYPLNGDRKGDRVLYRNLIRTRIEMKPGDDPDNYFARETFADKLALHWHDSPPEVLSNEGTLPDQKLQTYFSRVMSFLMYQRSAYGAALIKFR